MALLSPSTLPRSANLVHVRAPRPNHADPALREPLMRLAALSEPADQQAAVLALLAAPGSRREREAWEHYAGEARHPQRLYADVMALTPVHRLPWLEHFARALAHGPVPARHDLIGAARRVMTADGLVTRLDQLRWVALRHLLAGSAVSPPAAAQGELAELDNGQARCICVYAAFLSHLVPAPELTLDLTGFESPSQSWYDTVTAPWHGHFELPAREGHDIDASLRALRVLQSLPWLQRPVLVRGWFDAARALTEGSTLHTDAADALRLSCVLLDSPVPPELGQQYIEVEPARH
jgi:truncated hemoglobin YjbI